jgi:ribonuclease BN (tRNA processing enzyme)
VGRLRLQLLGTGDAFGSGGRLQTCFHVTDGVSNVLIDCGATSLTAIRRAGLSLADVDVILISHLHGDHFGGVPFVLLDASFAPPRSKPLLIGGPPGIEQRVFAMLETMFHRASERVRARVSVVFQELAASEQSVGPLRATAFEVVHPSGAPSFALRIGWNDKVVAFSGDTEWTDALLNVARDADLFLCECYSFEKTVPFHLSYRLITEKLDALHAKRVILTHMGAEMLAHRADAHLELAEDGMQLEV